MTKPDYNDKDYDYIKYWEGRDYENASELTALAKLLPVKGKRILDVGGGFGRLIPVYQKRFSEAVIFDQSRKLLKQAQDKAKSMNMAMKTKVGDIYKLSDYELGTFDCVVMVRIAHHLEDLDKAFLEVSKVMNKNGIFILEFANKLHAKSAMRNAAKLNFNYFRTDPVSRASKDVTFLNFHPDYVERLLKNNGFKVKEKLSVSNFRLDAVKRSVSKESLLVLENLLQKPFSHINFGPSIFVKSIKSGS
ncbi:class I SAM-dependent methyltransferase [Patescibacteria group bacterium]|nr:class I SAM-dependent methyltransferase [Patescibacteria group bacterium]MBU1970375.1 class I SAM-dependent methyltransferase [Patescibacteria group bacterium]